MKKSKTNNYYFINKVGVIVEVPFKICNSNLEEARKIATIRTRTEVDYIGTSKDSKTQQEWFETFFN